MKISMSRKHAARVNDWLLAIRLNNSPSHVLDLGSVLFSRGHQYIAIHAGLEPADRMLILFNTIDDLLDNIEFDLSDG